MSYINLLLSSSFNQPAWFFLLLIPFLKILINHLGSVYSLPKQVFDVEMRYWYINHNSDENRKRLYLILIDVFFWLSLSVTLAGPAYAQTINIERATVKTPSILIALDASASMNAEDVQPSRFLRAKNELLLLVDRLKEGQRLGLVLFTSRPHLLFPPTSDRSAQEFYINLLKPDMLPFTGSDITGAIKYSYDLLNLYDEHKNSHIVVISDGDLEKPAEVLQSLKHLNKTYKVSTLGIGTYQQAAVPAYDGDSQWMLNNNKPVFSSKNDQLLNQISAYFDGYHLTAAGSETKLVRLIDDSISSANSDDNSHIQWIQLYHPFLFLAALLFFANFILQRE